MRRDNESVPGAVATGSDVPDHARCALGADTPSLPLRVLTVPPRSSGATLLLRAFRGDMRLQLVLPAASLSAAWNANDDAPHLALFC